jgi:hypothetical protein
MRITDSNLQIISDNFLATNGSFNYFFHEYNRFNTQLFAEFVNAFLEIKLDELPQDEKILLHKGVIHTHNNFMRHICDAKKEPYQNYRWDAVEIFEIMLQLFFSDSQALRESIQYDLEQIIKTQNDELIENIQIKPLFEKLIDGQIKIDEFLVQFEIIATKVKSGQFEFLKPGLELINEQIQIAKDKNFLDKQYICSLAFGFLETISKS